MRYKFSDLMIDFVPGLLYPFPLFALPLELKRQALTLPESRMHFPISRLSGSELWVGCNVWVKCASMQFASHNSPSLACVVNYHWLQLVTNEEWSLDLGSTCILFSFPGVREGEKDFGQQQHTRIERNHRPLPFPSLALLALSRHAASKGRPCKATGATRDDRARTEAESLSVQTKPRMSLSLGQLHSRGTAKNQARQDLHQFLVLLVPETGKPAFASRLVFF